MRILAQRINSTKFSYLMGLVVFGLSLLSVSVVVPKVYAGECDTNAIFYCGFTSKTGFIDAVKKNRDGLGHTDLQAIYAHTGMASADYDRFVSSARSGTAYKDGRVVVGGQTVMTNTLSYGRNGYAGEPYVINKNTYYRGTPATRWQQDSFAVNVLFDSKGVAQFVVIDVCGNPLTGTKATAGATCTMLNKTPVKGKLNTYAFTTSASVAGIAKYQKFVYTFGDGTSATTTSPTAAVEHTYAKPGKYTASVTVYYTTPGGTYTVTSAPCKTTVEVLAPYYECMSLTAGLVNQTDKYKYLFTATARYGNGATLTGGSIVFGDGKSAVGTKSADGKTITTEYRYAKAGTYTVTATLKFNYGATAVTKTCSTKLTVVEPFGRCDQLSGSILDKEKYSYRFIASMSYGNGASFISADFDFGDGKTATGVKSSDGKTVTVDHTYAVSGTYSAVATLRFTSDGNNFTAPGCRASVTPETPPVPECKPGIPVGDIRCNPCEHDASIPKDDPRCVAPAATLPNTGAGNIIALASAALVGGFLWYRHILFRRHKRAYLAADLGASPLPLAEPLESPDPLAATPLAPQTRGRFSMRRRRQY